MFRSPTASFDRLLDKCTSQLLLEPDWSSILMLCDAIRGGDVPPKYAVSAIKKKFYHENPHVQLFSLQVSLRASDGSKTASIFSPFLSLFVRSWSRASRIVALSFTRKLPPSSLWRSSESWLSGPTTTTSNRKSWRWFKIGAWHLGTPRNTASPR